VPWKLLATPDAYILAGSWLLRPAWPCSRHHVSDYFLIRKTELDVNSLYHREGIYYDARGINPRAIVALVLGVAIALVGMAVKRCISSTTTRGSSASSRREFCMWA